MMSNFKVKILEEVLTVCEKKGKLDKMHSFMPLF